MPEKLYFEKWLLQINSISHGSYFAFLMPIMGVPNYMICIINQNSSCVAAAVQQLNNKAFISKLYKYIFTQMMQFRALLFTFFWSVNHTDIFNCQCFLDASKSGVWGMQVPGIGWEGSFCYCTDILALELVPSLSLPLSYGNCWVIVLFHVQQWWFYLSLLGPWH